MLKLALFDAILIGLCAIGTVFCGKFVKSERAKKATLIIVSLSTVACHYSSLLYHLITVGTAMDHLTSNPNLLLPIYPCNVVMWCCVIFAFTDAKTKLFGFLADYIFLFGLVSTLVGMFANVDFIRNPTLGNYDVTTGIISHAIMLFNVILIPVFGYYRIDFAENLIHIFISIVGMFVVGCYCNLVVRVIGSESYAYSVNSMFILHSPFEGLPFVKYPLIAGVALVSYAVILFVCDMIMKKKRGRIGTESEE